MDDLEQELFIDRICGGDVTIVAMTPARAWLVSGHNMPANTCAGAEPRRYWLAPGQVLALAESATCAPPSGVVSDVTDGIVSIAMAGAGRHDLLAMATPRDPTLLQPGRCARSLFAGLPALLAADANMIVIYMERSLAPWLLTWLRTATAERVTPLSDLPVCLAAGRTDGTKDIGGGRLAGCFPKPSQHHLDPRGSCRLAWCRSGGPEPRWLPDQAAPADSPMSGSSLGGAMVSSVM